MSTPDDGDRPRGAPPRSAPPRSAPPRSGVALGYAVGFALLRLDVAAIARLDGSVEEARESLFAILVSLPIYLAILLLSHRVTIGGLTYGPALVVYLANFAILWLAIPVIVSVVAPAAGHGDRLPLFITVYDYFAAVTLLPQLAGLILINLSDSAAIVVGALLELFWLWILIVAVRAYRATLRVGWQAAIALVIADLVIGQLVSDWSDGLVQGLTQS